jgi:general secretion pathway protein M
MNAAMIDQAVARHRSVASAVYVAILGVLVAVTWFAVADILDRQRALRATADHLEQLRSRNPAAGAGGGAIGAAMAGSPFLEGPTVTVAGAALLQRVGGAIAKVGGSVQSSQVDVQGARTKNGFISLLVSCEMDQSALQALLYDLEAGMPFLFVDQLDVQAPQGAGTPDDPGRLRVMLGISGQWQGNP